MNSLDEINKVLEHNRNYFLFLEKCIVRTSSLFIKYILAKRAIKLAVWSSTGQYCSPVIENVYLEIAKKIRSPIGDKFEKNSTLHIMTECYGVGGHSKVVERWISLCENTEKHSIIFTNQKVKSIPRVFLELVKQKKDGEVISLSNYNFILSKAKILRKLASGYERIVLHTHMYDVVPLVAFGTEDFTRPIILYNHADHLFWLGATIADTVAETREWGKLFSQSYRNIEYSSVLSIPPENLQLVGVNNISVPIDGIRSDYFTILSVGSGHKFIELNNDNYTNYMKWVLKKYSNVIFILVGPIKGLFSEWDKLSELYPNRIHIIGPKPNDELHRLIRSSHLVVDSFPMSGGTVLGDAVSLGVPVLALRSITGHLDYTYKSESYCNSFEELLYKTERFFSEPIYRTILSKDIIQYFNESENIQEWKLRLDTIQKNLPQKHKLKKIDQPKTHEFSDLDRFILKVHESKRTIFNFFGIISISVYRRFGILRMSIERTKL
ncbi:hypothetical protein VR7878_02231 [Vibrio ruber DSM 16370]|uniref:Glycosyl transferases group 1 n=1 Tax=Vibrio ruber (strain DSM 16370 / JCM 11486 / BCRC 17186 / CECT 7878 / LMG 23124 / VR1) TaxID=1123498 RepID=A0A1R4LL17_VIBR1|nr:hypothetical protein [Vibrio ruber]SJN57301.1 hypothetical protein VR7878_02231 [Vibrio ruber DSM 16370]